MERKMAEVSICVSLLVVDLSNPQFNRMISLRVFYLLTMSLVDCEISMILKKNITYNSFYSWGLEAVAGPQREQSVSPKFGISDAQGFWKSMTTQQKFSPLNLRKLHNKRMAKSENETMFAFFWFCWNCIDLNIVMNCNAVAYLYYKQQTIHLLLFIL